MIFEVEADGRLLPGAHGLSEEQGAALALDRHVVVTAGAGSGKTRTLARRTLRILGSFAWRAAEADAQARDVRIPGPEAVIVSTFTERAAAEMKERIRHELVEGLRELRARDRELAAAVGARRFGAYERHLRRCLRTFHRARIGTFHGFCAALLREFAALAGLDPGFAVLTGPESKELRGEAVDTALLALDAGRADLLPLVADPGRRAARDAAMAWLDKRDELAPFDAALDSSDDEALLLRWCEDHSGADPDALEAGLRRLAPALSELAQVAEGCAGFELGEAAARTLADLDEPLTALTERGERLRAAFGRFATGSGTPYKKLKGVGRLPRALQAPARGAWADLRAGLVREFGEAGEALAGLPGAADALALPRLRALSALSRDAGVVYAAAKEQARALDFQDLQLRLRALLTERPDVAETLRGRYEHILVDEFQDTNALQWELVRALLGDPLPERGLFLVGDPKQAIYRFRGGDVTMFDRARIHLPGVRDVRFTTNYRSTPPLIGAFNCLFSWLMPSPAAPRPAWEAPFEPLRPARDGAGGVDLLWLPEGAGVEQEAAALVERLPALLAEHPPRDGVQVAILLRRRRHMGAFAAALRSAGLPHVVARGRGFFSRQEILDVADLLLTLAHADDSVALVGTLRGPFLGLEDAWLLWLARQGGSGPQALRRGWDSVLRGAYRPQDLPRRWGELPEAGRAELLRAARTFARWRELRRRLPLSALLRAVLEDSAAPALFARQDPTGQVQANLDKLVSLAVAFDAHGPEGLAEFGQHLQDQDEQEVDEGEAALDATAPVVLMTIHQSKGLEFPVVILPDLGSGFVRAMNRRVELGRLGEDTVVGPTVEVLRDGARSREDSLLRRLLKAQDRGEQRAEAKRLLYVAWTRARDRLICLGVTPAATRGVDGALTWAEWLRSWQEEDDLPTDVRSEDGVQPPNPDGSAAPAAPPAPPEAALRRALSPIPRHRETLVLPSELLGPEPPPGSEPGPSGPPPSDPRELARERGTLVHACAEDGLLEPGPATERRVDHALAAMGRLDDDHRRWMNAELALHRRGLRDAALPPGLREVAFQLPLGDGRWLHGAIDLLLRRDGGWVVVDYKTHRGDEALWAAHHRPQLIAYAWAAARILPEVRRGAARVSAELLFTATGRRLEVVPPSDEGTLHAALAEVLPAPHDGPAPLPGAP